MNRIALFLLLAIGAAMPALADQPKAGAAQTAGASAAYPKTKYTLFLEMGDDDWTPWLQKRVDFGLEDAKKSDYAGYNAMGKWTRYQVGSVAIVFAMRGVSKFFHYDVKGPFVKLTEGGQRLVMETFQNTYTSCIGDKLTTDEWIAERFPKKSSPFSGDELSSLVKIARDRGWDESCGTLALTQGLGAGVNFTRPASSDTH